MGSRRIPNDKHNQGPFYVTEEGLMRLREKLAHLERILPGLVHEVTRTAAYGDRSDNAEYKDAKGTLRRTQGSIFRIQDQLRLAVIIKEGANASGMVELGSTVTLESDGRQKIFQILGSHESRPEDGRISHESPLGAALMRHKAGDSITVQTKNGSQEYRILEIR
ncbi:MAG: GreA/GreB family elongation factor [bacterium]|nr:GreA/GreB family elongation factor [bacterium]